MKTFWTTILISLFLLIANSAFTQGHHHNGPHHDLWPDSLETITVTGSAIVDSSFFHPMYYLDENGDGAPEYHLAFGPWWYEPGSGATRPIDGETVTITGALQDHISPPTLIVFEINGLTWREPVQYGGHGWNGGHFWDDEGDALTVTGVAMIDTSYFYEHYFLDVDSDSIPEYKLGFGPPWYEPESGATRPADGETVTIFGRLHEMMGIDMLSVYEINGLEWRPLDQPAPWAGMWMHRDHSDTTYAHCVNDSAHRIGFPPGHTGHGGGMMWPDSMFVQFWEIHPDSLPGGHNQEHFRGFYLNMHDPQGIGMMNGQFGGHHGMMHFQKEHVFRFHYDDEMLAAAGLSEAGMMVKYWNSDAQQWLEAAGIAIDTEGNTVTFSSGELSNYYTLSAPAVVTGVEDSPAGIVPGEFILHQNYPNPFNPSTNIHFDLPQQAQVQLSIYNLLGQRIAVLIDENKPAGVYTVQWDGRNGAGKAVASGIYLMKLEAGQQVKVKRMLLLK